MTHIDFPPFEGKSSQREGKERDEGEIDSEDSDAGVGDHSDSNGAPNKAGDRDVMSIPKKHSNGNCKMWFLYCTLRLV